MKVLKKALVLLLAVTIIAGILPLRTAQAATKPGKPVITLEAVGDGTDVKITIKETTGAKGYKIMMIAPGEKKSKTVKTLKKDGTAVRTYTLKNLAEGEYAFKVKAYNNKKSESKTVYGSYSKVKHITVKKQASGGSASEFSKAKTGDYIVFGSYEQDNDLTNGKEPIEWLVLSNNGKELFVVSKYALDAQSYNSEDTPVTWEECSLRKWLNEDFYNAAFSAADKKIIKKTKVKNNDNPEYGPEYGAEYRAEYGSKGGNDTKDNVFLLSIEDMVNTEYGFNSDYGEEDIARRCAATAYVKAKGVFEDSKIWGVYYYLTSSGEPACDWWLRSPGAYADYAASVQINGKVGSFGYFVYDDLTHFFAVRPALVINLK